EDTTLWLTARQIDDCTVYSACLSRLPSDRTLDEFQQRLPVCEQSRIARFLRVADRQRSLVGLYLLDYAVRNAGLTWNWDSFTRTATGRPIMQPSGGDMYDGNISHSGDFVVCAIGPKPLGIDIEQFRDLEISEFRRYLPPAIYDRIFTAATPVNEFFRWWTRIESVLKADGRGLCDELSELQFSESNIILDNHRWHWHDCDIAPNYLCSLAVAN
ncbi:MAG TPA: 4'-phosphopantetheinyl transferase superfamily protein, partial [Armatimonadota bacterium]|nr:4'-phosphopantetheinyl transferase superfamily protein [Armatimonadota bacterium]